MSGELAGALVAYQVGLFNGSPDLGNTDGARRWDPIPASLRKAITGSEPESERPGENLLGPFRLLIRTGAGEEEQEPENHQAYQRRLSMFVSFDRGVHAS